MSTRPNFDAEKLREAVESAPDWAATEADRLRLHALKEQADAAYSEASRRMDEIWDREASRLFGPPPTEVHRSFYGGPSVHPGPQEQCTICPPMT